MKHKFIKNYLVFQNIWIFIFFILLTIKWDIAIVIATVNLKFVYMNKDFLNRERELSQSIGLCSIFQLPFSLILA